MFSCPSRRWGAALALVLTGCAGFSPDGAVGPVAKATHERLGLELPSGRSDKDHQAHAARVDALLSQPLSADAAVQVALLQNPGLQASLAELGIAEADMVQAGRVANPAISVGRLRRGSEVEIEFGMHLNLGQLITMPWALPLERERLQRMQWQATLQVLGVAHATRRAYVDAVAEEESVRYLEQALDAAGAGAELARRMAEAGQWSALKRMREESLHADTALALARGRQARASAREALARALGVSGEHLAFRLPERLPDLPDTLPERPSLEQRAMDTRLDLRAARHDVEIAAQQLGLAAVVRWVNLLEIGALHKRSNEAPAQRGVEIRFELPLFDFGGVREARGRAVYEQAVARASQAALEAQSQVRDAWQRARNRHAIALRYRDEIVPLRQRMAQENLLRYNAMQIGVFDLLADAREQIATVNAALDARRDYWLADADLEMSLAGPY